PDEMLWEAEVKFDVDAILAAAYAAGEIDVLGKATLINFYLDNKLYAYSEAGTVAEIAKKGNYIIGITIPEPATMVLLGMGGLLLRRRK
ncbi:MAG: PEP-CTERM sorting domain-containing protein, partial [Planctomycetota bacterium]